MFVCYVLNISGHNMDLSKFTLHGALRGRGYAFSHRQEQKIYVAATTKNVEACRITSCLTGLARTCSAQMIMSISVHFVCVLRSLTSGIPPIFHLRMGDALHTHKIITKLNRISPIKFYNLRVNILALNG